jgi:hypothetical protein
MSTSSVDVMQKNDDDTPVTWRYYEALHDHLQGVIRWSTDRIDTYVQAIQMKVDATDATINAMKTQVTDLQASIYQLT